MIWRVILALSLNLALNAGFAGESTPANPTNPPPRMPIGIEGTFQVSLPAADYLPKPLDDRTEVILRLDRVELLTNALHRYHFYYIGLEPGIYTLADFLIRPDGTRPDELGNLSFEARGVLPLDHNGQLAAHVPRPFGFIGGYRVFMIVLALAWVGGIAGIALVGRSRSHVAPAAMPTAVPSYAERLRPLVEAAAKGTLTLDQRAVLERLLIGFWREKLDLREARMAENLAKLKAHAQAGELLRAVERWLHRPGDGESAEVQALLIPYATVPQPGAKEVTT